MRATDATAAFSQDVRSPASKLNYSNRTMNAMQWINGMCKNEERATRLLKKRNVEFYLTTKNSQLREVLSNLSYAAFRAHLVGIGYCMGRESIGIAFVQSSL